MRHHPDGGGEVGRFGVFHQEAAGAEAQSVEEILVECERGEDDDAHAGELWVGRDLAGGLEPVEAWHPDVHQYHVGPELFGLVHGVSPVRCLTDGLDAVSGIEQCFERGPDEALVVRDQDADHGGDRTGRCALTWLVTAATRLCLDRLRSAARAREIYSGPWLPEPIVTDPGPESAAELSDSLTLGFMVLLDQLAPVERAVFVLADVFEVPYAEIAATVGRSPAACRQIASRARRRLRPDKQPCRTAAADRELVSGLLRALASGDVNEVVARLAPDVVCITDGGPGRRAARRAVTGSRRLARFLTSLARRYRHLAARPAVVGGSAGAILSAGDTIEQLMAVTSKDGVITSVYFVGNPEKLTSVGHPPLIE